MIWNRRQFLYTLGLSSLLPSTAFGFGESALIDVMELNLGQGTLSRPSAWSRLLYEIVHTTSIECQPKSILRDLNAPDLFDHPFAVLIGDGAFELPKPTQLSRLSRYLAYGGFLYIDDVSGKRDGPFDKSVRRLLHTLFPTRPLTSVPSDHSVYRSFFLIKKPMGRIDLFDHMESITVGNLSPVIYMRNDLSGALERDASGQGRSVVGKLGGMAQRREAIKLGINLMMYSISSNYKKDQAHVAELLRTGRMQ